MRVFLDASHVQALLAQLLDHGYGELHVRVHNHCIESIIPMPVLKQPGEAEGVHFGLTRAGTRASVPG